MTRIETDVDEIIVEIDGEQYPLAERTVEVADRLFEIERNYKGKPQYKMWLEELKVILGEEAYRAVFHSGNAENIDRIQMIFYGVAKAFNRTADSIEADKFDAGARAVATALSPINEMLKQLRQYESKK